MSVFDSIKSIEFDKNKNKIFGIKSGILWGHSKNENKCFPILYISKPKHISQKDFESILNRVEINIKK